MCGCCCYQGQHISSLIGDGEDVSLGVSEQPSLHMKAARREEVEGRSKGWVRDSTVDGGQSGVGVAVGGEGWRECFLQSASCHKLHN